METVLFVRAGGNPEVDGEGNVVADFASTSRLADETIVVDTGSSPPLRAGQYFISLAVFTRGIPVTGTLTATVERTGTDTSRSETSTDDVFSGEGNMLREKPALPGMLLLPEKGTLLEKQAMPLQPKKRIGAVTEE